MSNDAKKVSELGVITSNVLSANDRILVLHNPAGQANAVTIKFSDAAVQLGANFIPYASANTSGVVKVGAGLSINATGFLYSTSANLTALNSDMLPLANNFYSLGSATFTWKALYVANNINVQNMPGPYDNNSDASAGGVPLKSLYYDSNGTVKIRTA